MCVRSSRRQSPLISGIWALMLRFRLHLLLVPMLMILSESQDKVWMEFFPWSFRSLQ